MNVTRSDADETYLDCALSHGWRRLLWTGCHQWKQAGRDFGRRQRSIALLVPQLRREVRILFNGQTSPLRSPS